MFQSKDKLRISRGDDDVIWERELWSIQIQIHPSSSAILQSCCLLLGENSPQTPRKTHARTQDFFTERDTKTYKISSHRNTHKQTRYLCKKHKIDKTNNQIIQFLGSKISKTIWETYQKQIKAANY
jgi:hypothetical protein